MVKRVSLSDVARAAGVAKATASRALSGREDVGAATRARILDIAADMGYQPHRGAQALRTGRFGVIAVSVPLMDPRAGALIQAAAVRAADSGYQLLVDTERGDPSVPVRLERFDGMSVDGVLVLGAVAAYAGGLPFLAIDEATREPERAMAAGIDTVVAEISAQMGPPAASDSRAADTRSAEAPVPTEAKAGVEGKAGAEGKAGGHRWRARTSTPGPVVQAPSH